MNAYERTVERNKEQILHAALELFRTHGVKKTATSDIARKARVSPATVYNHFGSKENLVRAAVKYFLTSMANNVSKILDRDLPFPEKMQQILSFKSDMLGRYQGEFIQTIISEAPEIRHLVDEILMTVGRQAVVNFFEEGKRQGYINPELSTETIFRYMLIFRSGMAAESILSEDPEHNLKIMQELTPLFLYGLMGKPAVDGEK